MKTIFILGLIALSAQVFAGSAQSEITCSSASKKTQVTASLPGDSTEASVTVVLDATGPNRTKVSFVNQDMVDFSTMNGLDLTTGAEVRDIETRDKLPTSFGFSVLSGPQGTKVVNVSAYRNTIKLKTSNLGHRASFKAELSMVDPRPGHAPELKGIVVDCKLVQEI